MVGHECPKLDNHSRWLSAASSCGGKGFGIQDLEMLGLGFEKQGFQQVGFPSAQCNRFGIRSVEVGTGCASHDPRPQSTERASS